MCPVLVSRPRLPAVSARNWPYTSPAVLFGASVLGVSSSCFSPRQHEDLLALSCSGSFLAVEMLRHALSVHVDGESHGSARHCQHNHGTPWRSVSSSFVQDHQTRSAVHQCRRHIRHIRVEFSMVPKDPGMCEEFRCSCNSIELRSCIDASFLSVNSVSQTSCL